jgi:hypothetical protein
MREMPMPEMTVAARLRMTLAMYEDGVDMMRCNLRRQHPSADAGEIERRLTEWLRERPGADDGDCPGRPWPMAVH